MSLFEPRWMAVAAIALAGLLMVGFLGTSEDLRRAGGPLERRMIKRAVLIYVLGFPIAMGFFFLFPHPWNFVWMAGVQMGNAWWIRRFNRRQMAVREIESCATRTTESSDRQQTAASAEPIHDKGAG